jgi:AcrR family transcriptional regulator
MTLMDAIPDSSPKGNAKVTREDWLKLAGEVLIERGVSQVKVLTLANRLGVSRSSFYWYFRSRKDLLDQLLEGWEGRNTRAVLDHAARPAGNICRAVMHLFECFIDPGQFDPRLDFAVREWARLSPLIRARLDAADAARANAIRDMFLRHGYEETEAVTRARIIYFMQIGYYALVENEPFETRFSMLQPYLAAFTGEEPDPAEMWRFLEVARGLLAKRGESVRHGCRASGSIHPERGGVRGG